MATNMGNTRSALLRATALGGMAAALALPTTQASAATVSNLTPTGVTASGGTCQFSASYTVTGTNNDASGNDLIRVGKNRNGAPNGADISQNVPVGTTQTLSATVNVNPGQGRAEWALAVRESTAQSRGADLWIFLPTRAQLLAAGGACVEIAPNRNPTISGTVSATTMQSGDTIQLDGSGSSDLDGDALTFEWEQLTGPSGTIANSTFANASFTAPTVTAPTTAFIRLSVTDEFGDTVVQDYQITINPLNNPPTVNAGPNQTVAGGDTVQLSGSASDLDNDPLTTTWVQTGGPSVTLSNPSALNPTFTAPARARDDQTLTFELRADDGTVISSDTVEIVVAGNEAPNVVVTASPTSGAGNSQFTLDGSGTTDPEGDQIIYIWTQTGGATVTLDSPNAAVTTFTAPQALGSGLTRTLTFQLTAVDTFDESNSETVSVTINPNQGPTADAGADQSVVGGSLVTLDGSGSSDPEGDLLSYRWRQVSGPTVTINDSNPAQPTFTAPAATGSAQVIEFELIVDDGIVDSVADFVTITVLANRPPVADAGADQGPIDARQTVTLDGTGSSDPDNDTLTYSWVQTAGTSVTLSGANTAQPTFTVPQANDSLTFELTVSDGTVSATDTVVVETRATGSITIIQQINGTDTQVSFTSDLAALQTSVTTSGGTAQVSAQSVPTGTYTVTAADLAAQGIAVTDISCSDDDSTGNVASRTATINLAAGESVTCTFSAANSREAAQAAIYNYLTGRNQLILSYQPDLQRRLDRLSETPAQRSGSASAYGISLPGAEHLPIEASINPGQARLGTSMAMALGSKSSQTFDIWAEAYFSRATLGAQKADFSIFHIGADVKLGDSVLLGGLVQFDDYSDADTLEAGEAEGDGFMAGPYIMARLAPGLFAEARAAWGTSDNVVSPLQGQFDTFETSRSFYSGSLVGQLNLGPNTQLRPEVTVRYLSEDQKAYTDSLNIAIPGMTVDQGDVSFRPRLSHLIETESGFALRPFAEVEGIYTFGTEPDVALANLLPASFADTFGDFRGRIEGGVDLLGTGNFRASISGFYDGIGAENFSNSGIHIGVSFGF